MQRKLHVVNLAFTAGKPFADVFDAVLGAEVADELGYRMGDAIIVAHGIGAGIVTTVIAAVARAKAGKKADRPDRYYNLLDFLSVEALEAAMDQYEEEDSP